MTAAHSWDVLKPLLVGKAKAAVGGYGILATAINDMHCKPCIQTDLYELQVDVERGGKI